jgi:hypothetical protein
MALICPVCSTENRDGANFCRSCGDSLVAPTTRMPPAPSPEREWATTAPAQLRAPTIPAPLFDPGEPVASRSFFGKAPVAPPEAYEEEEHDRTVIVGPGGPTGAPSPSSASSSASDAARAERAERKRTRVKVRRKVPVERPPRKRVILLWLGLLVVALVMIVAGWYGYGTRKAPSAVEDATPPVSEPAAAAVATPAAEPPPAAPQAVEPPAPVPEAETSPGPAATAIPKPAAKPRKQAAVAAPPSSTPELPAPAVAAAPPTPAPAAPAEPQAMCGDRNFIAKAQCMAAQCLKPEFKAHAQCEAVRRQQRLEEEKRNPTLMN